MESSLALALDHFFRRLARWQYLAPAQPLAVGLMLAGLGAALASGLALHPTFDRLLPEDQPSVRELHRVLERTTGVSQVFVVVEADDGGSVRPFVDALVPRLRAIGAPWVGSAASGIQEAREFLLPRAGLFASTEDLERLDREIEERRRFAIARELGADLDDGPPPPLDAARLRDLLRIPGVETRFPDGYFQSEDHRTALVVVRAAIAAGELEPSREALRRIRAAVEDLRRETGASIRASYAGDLVTGLHEYEAVLRDLLGVGALGVALVLGIVLLYFRQLRALAALGITIACGCALSFGFTRLAIGHLNVATGFLFSIIAGNGINFGIIWQARYLEERRRGTNVDAAVRTAHLATWRGTLAAALAAAASYGSLAVTGFRGFREFAAIGGAGMLLCWFATILVLPPVLVILERMRPLRDASAPAGVRAALGKFEAPFVALVKRWPRTVVVASAALALFGAVASVRWLRADPFEYDMNRLQTAAKPGAELYAASAKATAILGSDREGAMVLLCDRPDQVAPLRRALLARSDADGSGRAFGDIVALQDLVPEHQERKIPLVLRLREKLISAQGHGAFGDAESRDLAALLPPAELRPFGLSDLPDGVAEPFTERDGTRGRLVYISPAPDQSDDDLRYLLRWADSFRETRLRGGEVVRGSGRAVIFADMLLAVVRDMPRALSLSLLATALAVMFAFGRRRGSWLALVSLAVGLCWMGACIALGGVRLNFLNFMALPITLGVGVDYAVNLLQRSREEGGDVVAALRGAGGAVALCSLTTTLGYLALLGSTNQAIRSLGVVAVLGEICTLSAALGALPALLLWRGTAAARKRITQSSPPIG